MGLLPITIIGIFDDDIPETLMFIDFPIAFNIESERNKKGLPKWEN